MLDKMFGKESDQTAEAGMVKNLAVRRVFSPLEWPQLNTDLNDMRIIICLRKFEVFVERIAACNVTENWQSIAYTVCHALKPVAPYICYHSN